MVVKSPERTAAVVTAMSLDSVTPAIVPGFESQVVAGNIC